MTGSSLLDMAEAARIEGILSQIEVAQSKPFSSDFKLTLTASETSLRARLNEIGGGVFDVSADKKKEEAERTAVIGAVVRRQVQAQEMRNIANNGFSSWGGFDNFCNNLNDDKFLSEFGKLDKDEKTKMSNQFFDKLAEGVEQGKISEEEAIKRANTAGARAMAEFATSPNTNKFLKDEKSLDLIIQKTNEFSQVAGEKIEDSVAKMRASEDQINRKIENGESIESEDRFANYDNSASVKNAVYKVAIESSIETLKQEFDEKVGKLKLAGVDEDAAIKATEEAEKVTGKGVAMGDKDVVKPLLADNKEAGKDMNLSFLSS